MWTALGLDADVAESPADMDLVWNGKELLVSQRFQSDPSLIDAITSNMLAAFRFRKFSESRWLTVGESSRTLVAGLLLGLRESVEEVRNDTHSRDYYLHGFGKLSDELVKYACVLALAPQVPDGALLDLLGDDRLAQRADIVREVLREGQDWIASVGPVAWQRLASLLGAPGPKELRTCTLLCAASAAAFFW